MFAVGTEGVKRIARTGTPASDRVCRLSYPVQIERLAPTAVQGKREMRAVGAEAQGAGLGSVRVDVR